MPFTLPRAVHAEIEIRKSRFICCVEPVADRAAAQLRVAGLKAAHPAAAHVCWALHAGGQSAANDDGEPSGTAGRPMLEVLRHQQLEGVMASVVRYYGGIKLGAGGLLRAYTDSVAQALLHAERLPLRRRQCFCCAVPYALEGKLRRVLQGAGAQLQGVKHGAEVVVHFTIDEDDSAPLMVALNENCHGQLRWLDDN